jgi:hypothetical protein
MRFPLVRDMKRLVAADAAPIRWSRRSIYRVWPDFRMHKLIDASIVTVKAFHVPSTRVNWQDPDYRARCCESCSGWCRWVQSAA